MRLTISSTPLISVALLLAFFVEAVNVRFGQILFVLIISFMLYRYSWRPIIIFLCLAILLFTTLVNVAQLSIYLTGVSALLTLFSGQFLFQEFTENPFRLFKCILFTWGFVLIFLLAGLFVNGNIASSIENSHNHVNTLLLPFFILASCVMLRIDDFSNNEKIKGKKRFLFLMFFSMSLITSLISIFLTGRTGVAIGALGILFMSVLIRRKFKLFDLIFIYVLYLVVNNFNEIYLFLELYSGGVIKFISNGATEDVRFEIISDWISMLPDLSTWLGVPYNYFVNRHGVGSHNSFVQIYETLGMLGTVFFVSITAYTFVSYLLRGRYLILILFLMLILRMFTDSLFNSTGILTAFWFLVFCAGGSKFKRSILRQNGNIFYSQNKL